MIRDKCMRRVLRASQRNGFVFFNHLRPALATPVRREDFPKLVAGCMAATRSSNVCVSHTSSQCVDGGMLHCVVHRCHQIEHCTSFFVDVNKLIATGVDECVCLHSSVQHSSIEAEVVYVSRWPGSHNGWWPAPIAGCVRIALWRTGYIIIHGPRLAQARRGEICFRAMTQFNQ